MIIEHIPWYTHSGDVGFIESHRNVGQIFVAQVVVCLLGGVAKVGVSPIQQARQLLILLSTLVTALIDPSTTVKC